MAFITIAGQNQIAKKQGENSTLNINKFVMANVPNLGSEPATRIENIPNAYVVDQLNVTKSGYVNTNQVVYSLVMGSNVGDYQFNWVGLVDDEGVLIAVTYIPLTTKNKNNGGVPGNTFTRNFLLSYTGIQQTTSINVPAETWQIDFSARLSGIDERERLSNLDIYGHEGFLNDGWKVTGSAGAYSVAVGIGYVGGIRAKNATVQEITTATFPNEIWLNISLQGDISDMTAVSEFVIDTGPFADYVDGNGIEHYLTKIADIDAAGEVTEARSVFESMSKHIDEEDPHPQYFKKVGGVFTGPVSLVSYGLEFKGVDLRNLSDTGEWCYLSLACGVDASHGPNTVHIAYTPFSRDGALADSLHFRLGGGQSGTQFSVNRKKNVSHVPLYDGENRVASRDLLNKALVYPEILTGSKTFQMDVVGSNFTIAVGQSIRMRGWNDISTDDLDRSFSIDTSKTYHVRFSVESGVYLKAIDDITYNPDSLDESDRSFDTTYDDALLAKVEGAVVTPLINSSSVFSFTYDGMPNSADAYQSDNDYVGSFELPLNWSRSPVSDSVEMKGHLINVNGHAWNDTSFDSVIAMREDAVLCPLNFDKTYILNRYQCRLPVAHANSAGTAFLQMFEKIVRVYGY